MAEEVLVSLGATARRYGRAEATINRWIYDKRLNFREPQKIRNRRFWRLADLEKFEAQFADRFGAREETAAA